MRARSKRLIAVATAAALVTGAAGLTFAALGRHADLFYTPELLLERGMPMTGPVSYTHLLSFRKAELIGTDQWRLSGLLRGLNGSEISEAVTGAVVVLVDENLVQADFSESEVGLSLKLGVNEDASREFTYTDTSGLPWSVGHLRASEEPGGWNVSWVRRGADISDSWALPETDNIGVFMCQVLLAGELITTAEVSEPTLFVDHGADEIRVSQVSNDGRVGNWVSIPLIAD